ncbi:hypothetical protein [Anaerosphaera multitolerans]|uniref:Uncharacterized protein n=1 Tax=Anaerosphaera multitolerans TaxID=2487351 RepID=A0A437S478_9FIRM|nr:hypothetical protein [Anaerosphaera multitolerans]RVU53819.1 hypothetical protein EF514_10590 [Anaerosphaera multitolerans]
MKVNKLPVSENKEGYYSILVCDGEKLWHEYKERPLTDIEIANKRIEQLENVVDELLMGGAR